MDIEKEIEVINKIISSVSNNDNHNDSELLASIISWIKFKKIAHIYTVKKITNNLSHSVYKIVRKNID